jgi:PIN domain nuclease of toxin-antitoxin system
VTTYLADACALIEYYAPSPRTLSPQAIEILDDGDLQVAAVTVWEILRKVGMGRLPLPAPLAWAGRYPDWLREQGYRLLPLDWEDAALAASLPDHHRDPMDRFLIAASLRRDWPVITMDPIFPAYGVRVVW